MTILSFDEFNSAADVQDLERVPGIDRAIEIAQDAVCAIYGPDCLSDELLMPTDIWRKHLYMVWRTMMELKTPQ